MKLCLQPYLEKIQPTNGIGRIVYAQHKHLPALGFEFVTDPNEADLCIGHTQQFDMPRIDVLSVHGFYWLGDLHSGQYGEFHGKANQAIVDACRKARAITVPSRWVGECFRRDMRIDPVQIGHGIDLATWKPDTPRDYILWNKNRIQDVCNPIGAYEMAKRGLTVLSTFAPEGATPLKTMQVIGLQPENDMRRIISQAGLYLATVKETFGIGTLEALACGVPVVGFDQGGTGEIITSGYNGLLVRPGDYDALYEACKVAFAKRDELSQHALETAQHYDWPDIMQQYADLYQRVYEEKQHETHGVSIIITNHNYGQYIQEAIDSVGRQTRPADEVIIVDDGSTDGSVEVIKRAIVGSHLSDRFKLIVQENRGVADARTAGLKAATQPYVCLLDADDAIAPEFIARLLPPLIEDRSLGIAYSAVLSRSARGDVRMWEFDHDFDWEAVAKPSNPPVACVPSACLFRREMWLRAGPHKQEYAPGEDTEFWTRGLSIGYKARRVTNEPLFLYRVHEDSASRTKPYRRIDDRLPWMRDRRYPLAAPSKYTPMVMSYSEPKVSVIVKGTHRLPDTLDSLLGQTMREWEVIVISDQPVAYPQYPFIRQVEGDWNRGLKEARADLVMLMDSGDMLTNSALNEMLLVYIATGKYIYSQRVVIDDHNQMTLKVSADYKQTIWQKPLHGLTALLPREWAREIGLKLGKSEVADFYSRLALAGYCGQYVQRPLMITRQEEIKPLSPSRCKKLGGTKMASCCGGNAAALIAAKQAIEGMALTSGNVVKMSAPAQPVMNAAPSQPRAAQPKVERVVLEYIGANTGSVTYTINGHQVRGGRNELDGMVEVERKDAERMIGMGFWRVAQQQQQAARA